MLNVDNIHTIYVQESGNKNGTPILCLHGGPGYPMTDSFQALINPNKFRIITFHQRGSGRSTPSGCLVKNNTKHLLSDIEKIRKYLNIKKWIVEGGSWGATLGVVYAIHYPQFVKGLILFGLSLFDDQMEEVTKISAPDVYDKWLNGQKTDKKALKSYIRTLKSKRIVSSEYEDKLFNLMKFENIKVKRKPGQEKYHNIDTRVGSLLESHYYMHKGFLKKNYILKNAYKLKNIRGFIICGRFDIICSPKNSYLLSKKWKKGKLIITPLAGHSMWNKNNAKELQYAYNQFI